MVSAQITQLEKKFKSAKSDQDRIEVLEKILEKLPKTKKSEEKRESVEQQIVELRETMADEEKKSSSKFSKKGAATIVLIGPPNSGKSTILQKLTGKKVKISETGFTTTKAESGTLDYKGVKIQVVELPAIALDYNEKEDSEEFFSIVRESDLSVIVTHHSNIEVLFKEMEAANIGFNRVSEDGMVNKRAVILVNKADSPMFGDAFMGLHQYHNFELMPISAENDNLKMLMDRLWKHLGMSKIYNKKTGQPVNKKSAVCVPEGSTVGDFAGQMYKNYEKRFQYARVWGKSAKAPGMKVGLQHQLEDEDTVEVVISKR